MQKLGFIPEAQNDMVFSVICEELGLFGGICLIILFILLIWRFMVIANNAPDLFGSMLVVGVMAHISLQVILNIAVVTNVIPNTGVTLPFISYGGTSVLFACRDGNSPECIKADTGSGDRFTTGRKAAAEGSCEVT